MPTGDAPPPLLLRDPSRGFAAAAAWAACVVLPLVVGWGCCGKSAASGQGQTATAATASASVGKLPPSPPPTTPDGCQACNGVWGVHGIAKEESCVCRTTDGGKRCRDGGDCQGMCIAADNAEREVVQAGPPARGYFVGRCSDMVTVFGCNRIIDRGAAAAGPIVLGEPPQTLCVD